MNPKVHLLETRTSMLLQQRYRRHGGVNLLGHDDIWDNLMRIKSPAVAAELLDISLGDDKWETWEYEQ